MNLFTDHEHDMEARIEGLGVAIRARLALADCVDCNVDAMTDQVQDQVYGSVKAHNADYALRAIILDASVLGITTGIVFEFGYEQCGGFVNAGDFSCFVIEASDDAFAPVEGVACSVAP